MGGDKLVAAVALDDVEERLADGIRGAAWELELDALLPETEPLAGAVEQRSSGTRRGAVLESVEELVERRDETPFA
jgi:hypothetical protein